MTDSRHRKLLWLIGGRAAVITLLLGSAILIQLRAPGAFPIDPFFAVIGVTYALSAVWAATLRFVDRAPWLVDVQLACDAIIVSAVVLLTGGVGSYFSSLYTLPIIAASTVQSWRWGLTVSILSSAIYGGIVLAQYEAGVPMALGPEALPPLRVALFTVGLNIFGFLAVAGLSGYLAEGLRRAGVQLEETSTQLADLQAFSQHVIDSMTSGLATCDGDGRLTTFNRAAERITGTEARDAIGAPLRDVLQLPEPYHRVFSSTGAGATLNRLEYGFVRPDGKAIELGVSCAPLHTASGQSGLLFTFQDVTDVKKHERDMRVQQRLAAVGEMAAGIAHEIRNPLASMAGSIQILRDELPLTAEQSQLMDIVLRESDRLNETIRGFLAYAKPRRAVLGELDLRNIVSDTARLLEHNHELIRQHQIVVRVPESPVMYRADEAHVRQIVWNLATNALKAMPDGGRLELSIAQRAAPDDGVVLSVRDEGTGIAPEEVDGIFQPFRGGFGQGAGLGLSIVHRIVADYGGTVRVLSERQKGTTVEVALPPVPAVAGAAAL